MAGEQEKRPEIIETSTALESMTRGEVDMQVATARRYPRDLVTFRDRATSMATRDPETAALCEYFIPRGKGITGPSVRLAEIIASSWGNIRAEARPISEDAKFVTSQATVWDLETNMLYRHETRRRITGKDGRRYNDDMITVTANAASSIAYREAVFKVVPRSEWMTVYEASQKAAGADLGKLKQARAEWIETFAKGDVTEKQILSFLKVATVDDIGASDLKRLRGIYTALSEGSVSVDDIFGDDSESAAPNGIPAEGRGKVGSSKKKPEPEPQTEAPPADAKPAEEKPQMFINSMRGRPDRVPLLQTMDLIKSSQSKEDLDRIYIVETGDGREPRKEVRDALEKRWTELQESSPTTSPATEESPAELVCAKPDCDRPARLGNGTYCNEHMPPQKNGQAKMGGAGF